MKQQRFYHHAATVNDKTIYFILDRENGRPVDVHPKKTLARARVDTLNGRLMAAEVLWPRRDNGPKAVPAAADSVPTPGQIAYEEDRRINPTYLNGYRRPEWDKVSPEVQNMWEHVLAHSKKGFT